MCHETSSPIQEPVVDFVHPLRNVHPNIQGGVDFNIHSASMMLKMKFSATHQ
jgi:hypothetical protein